MFNILIDPLPREFEGYLIRWQFYNGILLSNTLSDNEFGSGEYGQIKKIYSAFEILYGKGIPPFEMALDGLKWFFNCGEKETKNNSKKEKNLFCFESDKSRIFSAFMVKFGINLNKINDLHWFEFIALMNDLDKTAFKNVVDLRAKTPKEIKKYDKETQAEIKRQQKIFSIEKALDVQFTDVQNKAIDHFDKLVGGKND